MIVVDTLPTWVVVWLLMCVPSAAMRCSMLCSTLEMAAEKATSVRAGGCVEELDMAVMASAISWRVGSSSSLRAAREGAVPSIL